MQAMLERLTFSLRFRAKQTNSFGKLKRISDRNDDVSETLRGGVLWI